jgi:hypothetical protein
VLTTHLHPLLGLAHCLQVTSHRRWVDQIIDQQLGPATTTRRGFGHRRRADWLRVLDLQRADDYLQSGFWQRVVAFSSSRHGSLSDGHLHRLGGSTGSSLSSRCHVFNGHRSRDITTLGFSTCHQSTSVSVITSSYDYSRGYVHLREYSPSTTLASGNVASAAGASGSA